MCFFNLQETIKRPSPQPKTESPSTNNESELERILQRRRGAFKTPLDSSEFMFCIVQLKSYKL